MLTHPPAWSTILQNIIRSTPERQRLSSALGVTTVTLSRWASGESKPQRPHLIHLLQVVHPDRRQELLEALEQQYPDIQSWLTEDTTERIPSEFFAQVLNMRTSISESLRFWRISEVVIRQALAQLDPNNLGMAVKLVQCMPPRSNGKILSLRERIGKGTPPWTADLEHDVVFLGLESLSGYAVDLRHGVINEDLRTSRTTPAVKDDYEVSAAACPICFEGNIAGCLLTSSTQAHYFSQQRLGLLSTFSDLVSLAFDKNDFYPPSSITLRVMPPPSVQRPMLATFHQRVTTRFKQSLLAGEHLNSTEIEAQVWQDLEQQLIDSQIEE